jgi:hypothetical protein
VNGALAPWWVCRAIAGATRPSGAARSGHKPAHRRVGARARRFGYRRIADLLRAAGTEINDERVYRLYRLADLSVRKRRGKQRLKLERVPLHECYAINEVWSMDFVSDSLASGRRIKCLTVTDDFSHECLDIAVDHGIGGEYVVRVLDQVARFRAIRRPCERTRGRSSPAGPSWLGHRRRACATSSTSRANLRRTPTSRASTASSATSA